MISAPTRVTKEEEREEGEEEENMIISSMVSEIQVDQLVSGKEGREERRRGSRRRAVACASEAALSDVITIKNNKQRQ